MSAVGRREKEAAFAKSLVRNLAELSRPVRLGKADAAAKRANFKLPPIDKTDMVGELRRQEMRAYVRSLPLEDRMNAVEKRDDTAVLAILDAPAMLSGLPEDRHAHIKNAYLERQFGRLRRRAQSSRPSQDRSARQTRLPAMNDALRFFVTVSEWRLEKYSLEAGQSAIEVAAVSV